MSESKSTWRRDMLIVPIIVGLIIALFSFGLDRISREKKELSYNVTGPTPYLDEQASKSLSIQINGKNTSQLLAYQVRLWNSGNKALRSIPVLIVFKNPSTNFQIFSSSQTTEPPYEFGDISEVATDPYSRKYVYELMNPGDAVIITCFANEQVPVSVFAKDEGLRLKQVVQTRKSIWINLILAVVGAISSMLSLFVKEIVDKHRLKGLVNVIRHGSI